MLANQPEVQTKLREEMRTAVAHAAVGEDGRLGFDEIMALPWLDSVLKETLRLLVISHPPFAFAEYISF